MKTVIEFQFTDDNGILIKDASLQTVYGEKYNISVNIGDLFVHKTCVENSSAVRDHIFYLLGFAHCKSAPRIRKGTITVINTEEESNAST